MLTRENMKGLYVLIITPMDDKLSLFSRVGEIQLRSR